MSMGALQTCPRKYQLQYLEGWVPKSTAPPLAFGILFHSAMEDLQELRLSTCTRTLTDEMLRDLVRKTLVRSKGFEGDEDGKGTRTRFTLVRALIWYADQFWNNSLPAVIKSNGRPATEESFRIAVPLINPDGKPFILCGHIDKVGVFADEKAICDHKTTAWTLDSKYFKQYSPNWQMSNYIFAGTVLLGEDGPVKIKRAVIDAAQTAQGFTRFMRGLTERTEGQIDEWLENSQYWMRLAQVFAEWNYWPMNESACHHYGGCMFREVCSKDPKVRHRHLKSDFKQDRWNPLRNRGD